MAEAEAIKTEEKSLKERRERKEKQADSLKQYLSITMQQLNKTKVETPRNVLSFRKSTSLHISDEEAFKTKYPRYIKIETIQSIPRKEIADLIKNGEILDGAELIEKQNLQIK